MSHRRRYRRSVRLKGYDYGAPGVYFVTLCTHQRRLLFEDPVVRRIAEACWRAIPAHAPGAVLDEWVVMPNHVHGIIVIGEEASQGGRGKGVGGRGVQSNAPTANTRTFNGPTMDATTFNGPAMDATAGAPVEAAMDEEGAMRNEDEAATIRGRGVQLNAPTANARTFEAPTADASMAKARMAGGGTLATGEEALNAATIKGRGVQLNAPTANAMTFDVPTMGAASFGDQTMNAPTAGDDALRANVFSALSPRGNSLAVQPRQPTPLGPGPLQPAVYRPVTQGVLAHTQS